MTTIGGAEVREWQRDLASQRRRNSGSSGPMVRCGGSGPPPTRYSRTGLVVLSGDANPQRMDNLLRAGADGYLTKPFGLRELFNVLDAAASTAGTV